MDAYKFIENHELVLNVFGRWPGFHDGEVYKVVLDRTRQLSGGRCYPSIDLYVRGWNMTGDITDEGSYRLKNDSLVHFLFENVSDLELDGLNHQNVISGLDFSLLHNTGDDAPMLSVEINHCYGLSGGFKALRASIISVVPIGR
jgi:hypothetical protein